MKIFLTGQPHSGKSTLLSRLIDSVQDKQGFLTQEIPDPENAGQRIGFEVVGSNSKKAVIAHVDNESDIRVSKYGVDMEAFGDFLGTVSNPQAGNLLYLDEVGQMQLHSERFKELVNVYLDSSNDFIGTLTAVHDDPFIEEVRANPDVEVIEVTLDNRDQLFIDLQKRFAEYL